MQNTIREAILAYAGERETFLFSDLFAYINKIEEIKKVSLSWYLKDLLNNKLLVKIGRGLYSRQNITKHTYQPFIRDTGLKVAKELSENFPFVSFNILDGETYVRFQHNISINKLFYIEVERDVMEAFFNFLKNRGYEAYINPDENFIYYNVDSSREAFIVKPSITESPLLDYKGVKTPSLEKLIIDIPCDKDLFYLQGNEWYYMLETIMDDYTINRSRMMRYASRRNFKDKLLESLKTIKNSGIDD